VSINKKELPQSLVIYSGKKWRTKVRRHLWNTTSNRSSHQRRKEGSKATLEVVGRDQPDQRLYLSKDQENLVWGLDHTENELWKQPPDPVLEAVAKIVSADNREWAGSPTELAQAIQTDMAVNRLTKHLNVNASRLLEEHQVKYENKTRHAGRRIRLTYMVVEAPAFEVIEVIE
jgi:hypothetical protein